MGLFRAGKFWSIENFNVKPDIIVFGKALTNGLNPLCGIWAKEELINPDIFPPGSTHSTYASNPLGTAVALETIKMLETGDYENMTRQKGAYFLEGLKRLKRKHKSIGDVDGLGMALRVEICSEHDSYTPDKALTTKINAIALSGTLEANGRRYGLVLDIGGYYKNVLTLAPNLEMSYEEIA